MILIFLFCFRNEDYMTPGYRTTTFSDSVKNFNLNYTLDNIFLFDNISFYTIKVKFLDMTEPETIQPMENGFSGHFMTEVEITSLTNGTHSIQIYSLPKGYCSHNYVSYYSYQQQTTRINWSITNPEKFIVCYLHQFPGHNVHLKAKLSTSSLSEASYLLPSDYMYGNYSGTPIPRSKTTEFMLQDGLIIRLKGESSQTNSYFDLVSRPLGTSKSEAKSFNSLPFYFVVSKQGYNFLNDINISLSKVPYTLFQLSIEAIYGLTLSIIIFVLVITLTTVFFCQKLNCLKCTKPKMY
ncbi:hypothetical protein TRFO_18942 [Tritrichomonas foetus]|uniref:Uncharacterized protein n=1 Tax=Tritrichomonas foetus TaxID=1144522 RepID=A0A1J4KKW2_9EUKA|nr:hypothetical protein TRFO_18942 [Tritrichomonas foetus]|eukprot:OHT11576.1 hypothetical protein TRFO_18942 [Tritrichomonas foetus]